MSETAEHMEIDTSQPRGFRDVYWCDSLNEPMLIKYDDQCRCYCDNCGMHSGMPEPDDIFLKFHRFIAHIRKPRKCPSPKNPSK